MMSGVSGVPIIDTAEATAIGDRVVAGDGTAKLVLDDNLDLSEKVIQQSAGVGIDQDEDDDSNTDDDSDEENTPAESDDHDEENTPVESDDNDEENTPAESDLQSLQTRNLYLERQNYLMQKMIDQQKQYGRKRTRIAGDQGCSLPKQAKLASSLELLPDLALKQILKYVPADEGNKFLNCRLVCVRWNEIIEDTSELMKKITFPVWHPKPFLDLPIVQKGKVKSISFKGPLLLGSEYTTKFINTISNTVEKVTFAFELQTSYVDIIELFKLILKKCTNLQELIIQKFFVLPLYSLGNIADTIQIAAVDNIQVLSIAVVGFNEANFPGFIKLISKLPQLKELNILSFCESDDSFVVTLRPLYEYLKTCASIKLQKLSFGVISDRLPLSSEHHQTFISLLILCGQRGILLADLPAINFNILLALADSPEFPPSVVQNHALFPTTVNGVLTFEGRGLTNLQRLDLLNVGHLRLQFCREIMEGELSWVKHINSVKQLTLTMKIGDNNGELRRLGVASIREFEEAFSAGLPSLEMLEIVGDLFDSIGVFQWARFFPNLKCLTISDCEITPDNLITELTGLQSLSKLSFISLPNLTDAAFTTEVINRFTPKNSCPELAPAICCFKSLTGIGIVNCPLLTDNCGRNGIAKSKTLKYFRFLGFGGYEGITDILRSWISFKIKLKSDSELD